jgi:hypothetical protein
LGQHFLALRAQVGQVHWQLHRLRHRDRELAQVLLGSPQALLARLLEMKSLWNMKTLAQVC